MLLCFTENLIKTKNYKINLTKYKQNELTKKDKENENEII